VVKSGQLARSPFRAMRAVCADAPSCWKMNPVGSRLSESRNLQCSDRQCYKFPTEKIMGAQNFNFTSKFFSYGDLRPQSLYFWWKIFRQAKNKSGRDSCPLYPRAVRRHNCVKRFSRLLIFYIEYQICLRRET